MESGTVSRVAVEALLARANAGDAEAAEVAGRLYDRGIGVKWDPPSALRWYADRSARGQQLREAGGWPALAGHAAGQPAPGGSRARPLLHRCRTGGHQSWPGPASHHSAKLDDQSGSGRLSRSAAPGSGASSAAPARGPATGCRSAVPASRTGARCLAQAGGTAACLSDRGAAGASSGTLRRLPRHYRRRPVQPPGSERPPPAPQAASEGCRQGPTMLPVSHTPVPPAPVPLAKPKR